MNVYRVSFDAYNSRTSSPSVRIVATVAAIDPNQARSFVNKTIYVDRHYATVNVTGGVGPDGHSYPERDAMTVRKISSDDTARGIVSMRVSRVYDVTPATVADVSGMTLTSEPTPPASETPAPVRRDPTPVKNATARRTITIDPRTPVPLLAPDVRAQQLRHAMASAAPRPSYRWRINPTGASRLNPGSANNLSARQRSPQLATEECVHCGPTALSRCWGCDGDMPAAIRESM